MSASTDSQTRGGNLSSPPSGAVAGRSRLYASIGRLAADAADVPGAIEAFARAVSASPNDPAMHKYLAGALLQQDRADEAFVELVAALLIDPLDADAHAGIGQIHLNAGRYDEAVTALRRAVELSADHTEARYALATALMRSGNTEEAARELERVEQAQRQMLANRRRGLALDVLKEEAALRAAEGRHDRAAALWQQASIGNPVGRPIISVSPPRWQAPDGSTRRSHTTRKRLRSAPIPSSTVGLRSCT